MRNNSTREHAANTVVGSIQRQAERALGEGWDLRSFRRDRRLPRSAVSEVFFAKASPRPSAPATPASIASCPRRARPSMTCRGLCVLRGPPPCD